MRDINGLEISSVNGINGSFVYRQTMLTNATMDIEFNDAIYIDQLFSSMDGRIISPNMRCIVQIGLRYSWDSDICPDFRIVVTNGVETLISSKQGLDDYPDVINTSDVTFICADYSKIRIKLTKAMTEINKFRLYVNSFIKIDVL